MQMHLYMHAHMHQAPPTDNCSHEYNSACMNACMHARMHLRMHATPHACMHACMHAELLGYCTSEGEDFEVEDVVKETICP